MGVTLIRCDVCSESKGLGTDQENSDGGGGRGGEITKQNSRKEGGLGKKSCNEEVTKQIPAE